MDATSAIAGYAAVVATGTFIWQVYVAQRSRRPDVEVTVLTTNLLAPRNEEKTKSGWVSGVTICVEVRVDNRGAKDVGVATAGLVRQDHPNPRGPLHTTADEVVMKHPGDPVDTIPGTVKPHHALRLLIPRKFAEQRGLDLSREVVGFAYLQTGETVRSKPTVLGQHGTLLPHQGPGARFLQRLRALGARFLRWLRAPGARFLRWLGAFAKHRRRRVTDAEVAAMLAEDDVTDAEDLAMLAEDDREEDDREDTTGH
jgi:hypothetical protein